MFSVCDGFVWLSTKLFTRANHYLMLLQIDMAHTRSIRSLCIYDHHIKRGKLTVIERILADIVYTLLFYIYGCLLIVWYTMYDEISYNVY